MFYSRVAESRSRRNKTGCLYFCPIFRCYSVFKASSPCLSAEPTEIFDLCEATKKPTSRRASVSTPTSVGRLPCLPLLVCQKVPRHQLWKYTTHGPTVKPEETLFRVASIPIFRPTSGLADPSPPGGMSPLWSAEISIPGGAAAPHQMSAPAIVAPFADRSSEPGENFIRPYDRL